METLGGEGPRKINRFDAGQTRNWLPVEDLTYNSKRIVKYEGGFCLFLELLFGLLLKVILIDAYRLRGLLVSFIYLTSGTSGRALQLRKIASLKFKIYLFNELTTVH